jgi:hypothetical protein
MKSTHIPGVTIDSTSGNVYRGSTKLGKVGNAFGCWFYVPFGHGPGGITASSRKEAIQRLHSMMPL